MESVIIGTRGSRLARIQAGMVATALTSVWPTLKVTIRPIRTGGDRSLDVPLFNSPQTGVFVKEIEKALIAGDIDIAVHSMKDMPSVLHSDLSIAAVLQRGTTQDALVVADNSSIAGLTGCETVGTSSLRRRALLLHRFPGLQIINIRGNIETRIRKVNKGECDATLLAACGLERAGLGDKICRLFDHAEMLPAACQGIIAAVGRRSERELLSRLRRISHIPTLACATAERSFLYTIQGGCRIPVACLSKIGGDTIFIDGLVASIDGRNLVRESISGPVNDGVRLGEELAVLVLSKGGREVLESNVQ